jgi:hypothetical protein
MCGQGTEPQLIQRRRKGDGIGQASHVGGQQHILTRQRTKLMHLDLAKLAFGIAESFAKRHELLDSPFRSPTPQTHSQRRMPLATKLGSSQFSDQGGHQRANVRPAFVETIQNKHEAVLTTRPCLIVVIIKHRITKRSLGVALQVHVQHTV